MNRFCQETGVGIIAYSPLFGGKLAHPVGKNESTRAKTPNPMAAALTDADHEIIRRVDELAGKKGWKMSHVALAWLREKGAVPITGFNSIKRVDEACELRGKSLTKEDIKHLQEPYQTVPIMGHM